MWTENTLYIGLMDDFFDEQFCVNDSEAAFKYWQVYDRTTDSVVSADKWSYNSADNSVELLYSKLSGLSYMGRDLHV